RACAFRRAGTAFLSPCCTASATGAPLTMPGPGRAPWPAAIRRATGSINARQPTDNSDARHSLDKHLTRIIDSLLVINAALLRALESTRGTVRSLAIARGNSNPHHGGLAVDTSVRCMSIQSEYALRS